MLWRIFNQFSELTSKFKLERVKASRLKDSNLKKKILHESCVQETFSLLSTRCHKQNALRREGTHSHSRRLSLNFSLLNSRQILTREHFAMFLFGWEPPAGRFCAVGGSAPGWNAFLAHIRTLLCARGRVVFWFLLERTVKFLMTTRWLWQKIRRWERVINGK